MCADICAEFQRYPLKFHTRYLSHTECCADCWIVKIQELPDLWARKRFWHYIDVMMSAIASQITSLMIVYSTVYPGAVQRKHPSSASLAFVRGIHRWPVASNAENVSIWWRHHDVIMIPPAPRDGPLPCCASGTLRDATALVTGERSIVPEAKTAPEMKPKAHFNLP